jgi:site-specific DNA-cytosine methylase
MNYHKGMDNHGQRTMIKVINTENQESQSNRIYGEDGISPSIRSGAKSSGTIVPIIQTNQAVIVAQRGRNPDNPSDRTVGASLEQRLEINSSGQSITLTGVQKDNMVLENYSIRRLTEIECERLQGFPDNWTKYGNYDGTIKEISRTQRYKMCGNAVTVDIVALIARKLLEL